jgi:tRNA threonylcarbamoyladenosine biosynthesis protein TsaE
LRKSIASAVTVWRTAAPADTEAVGAKLATAFPQGRDALTVVSLTGDLGAGKTTLARGFLHAAGVSGTIHSPTYTLLESYETPAMTVVHLDLYRLRDPSELEPLGLRDLAKPGFLWLIEWAERGAGVLPPADLEVRLAVGSQAHEIEARGVSDFGRAWLARLTHSRA